MSGFRVDYERISVVYERKRPVYAWISVDYERFNKKWGHPTSVDGLNHSAFLFEQFLYSFAIAMSGFVSTMRGLIDCPFLSSPKKKCLKSKGSGDFIHFPRF